ncbi:MAG: TonB-dependent receptor plug domain-containing protein, partial [Alistipes sp.]|nr:TonB-dependent receptor plug domain-containing protein [Alistipes sp.]
MKTLLAALSLMASEPAEQADTLYHIEQVEVTASLKHRDDLRRQPVSSTELGMYRLMREGVESIKDISAVAPNFYQPSYGSKMTSSIYVRGFGSRIDQPVVGVNVDDVPLMNKNAYDFDFYDIRKIDLLRGPQGTLYGRNTSGGVMNISTLSPLMWQGARLSMEYSSATSYAARAAYYGSAGERFGYSVAASYSHSDGFFTNRYDGEKCDWGDNGGVRVRLQWLPVTGWSIDNTLSVGFTDEGGYAYRLYDDATGAYSPIDYNDQCGYRRMNICEGVVSLLYPS